MKCENMVVHKITAVDELNFEINKLLLETIYDDKCTVSKAIERIVKHLTLMEMRNDPQDIRALYTTFMKATVCARYGGYNRTFTGI